MFIDNNVIKSLLYPTYKQALSSKIINRVKKTTRCVAAVDSAASGNYFPASYTGEAHDSKTTSIPVGTANDNVMRSVATDQFPLKGVPVNARLCYKFKEVSLPLVSVGKLCVHGMKVYFNEHHVKVYNKDNKQQAPPCRTSQSNQKFVYNPNQR